MAKDDKSAEEVKVAAPKSKLVLILVIILVIVLVAGGAATFLLLTGGSGKGKKHKGGDDADEGSSGKTVVVALEEKFTVNLQAEDGSQHYLQVPKVELEVGSPQVAALIEERKGKVSDRISSTLRAKTMKEMQAPGSDMKLKEDLKVVINEVLQLKGEDRGNGVKEVILPSSFIIQ